MVTRLLFSYPHFEASLIIVIIQNEKMFCVAFEAYTAVLSITVVHIVLPL